jgi:signal transduction histidine kinase
MAADALERVVVNLLTNAIEATSGTADAKVRLSTRVDGDHVQLDVADSGPGVPPEIEGRLFTPFVTARADQSGTGLGLALAREAVRQHGGTLDMHRENGETVFSMRLPVSKEPM